MANITQIAKKLLSYQNSVTDNRVLNFTDLYVFKPKQDASNGIIFSAKLKLFGLVQEKCKHK